jgi:hypothetical protein
MTKAKHTPGPWASEGTTLYALNDDGVNRFQACFGQGFLTYTKTGKDQRTSIEEVMANVALSKAAPNLLEALEELTEIIDKAGLLNLSNGVQLGPTVWYVKATERMDYARAAIAKAKGE